MCIFSHLILLHYCLWTRERAMNPWNRDPHTWNCLYFLPSESYCGKPRSEFRSSMVHVQEGKKYWQQSKRMRGRCCTSWFSSWMPLPLDDCFASVRQGVQDILLEVEESLCFFYSIEWISCLMVSLPLIAWPRILRKWCSLLHSHAARPSVLRKSAGIPLNKFWAIQHDFGLPSFVLGMLFLLLFPRE